MIMPMGDDDFDHDEHKSHHGLSKAEQRRSNKPIMEKKRRARINHCLNELKSLILDAMKKDPARHSKLEKADILEMTVKHLQSVQRQQLAVAVATDPNVLHKFKSGFNECAGEVSRYIGHLDGVELGVKQRLVSHLANCVTGLQQLSPFAFGNTNIFPNVPQDMNNNQRVQGVQLIPSRLPTGELALLVPNSGGIPTQNFFPNAPSSTVTSGAMERTHPSAFTAVSRSEAQIKSPPLSPSSSIASSDESTSDYAPKTFHVSNHQRSDNFKIPLRSPSGFKTFQSTELKSPQQHSVVSSTCLPVDHQREQRDDNVQTYAHVKLEFKSVPLRNQVPLQQPLSVVTSQVYNIPTEQARNNHPKNPLDFSFKKDIINRQCVSTQTPTSTNKRPHPSNFEMNQSNDLITSSMVSPNKMPRYTINVAPGHALMKNDSHMYYDHREYSGNNRNSSDRPSTSTAVSNEDKDMWRPW